MTFIDSKLALLSFEIGSIRPPSEGGSYSLLIRATRNCPWNKCTFCYGLPYNREKFQIRQPCEVKQDIDIAASICDEIKKASWSFGYAGDINRITGMTLLQNIPSLNENHSFVNVFNWLYSGGITAFLQDADSLIMPTQKLLEIIRYLKERFSSITRITSYARSKTLSKKKPDELKELFDSGLTRVHVGLETGDDDLLMYINKGVTAKEHIEAGRKVVEAGIQLSEYVMPGLGGKTMSEQHARNTSKVLNEVDPHFIRLRPFNPRPSTPVFEAYEKGEMHLLSPHEYLREIKIMIESLEVTSNVCFDHFMNPAFHSETGQLIHLFTQSYDGYKFPGKKGEVLKILEKGLLIEEERFLRVSDLIKLRNL